MRWYNVKYRLPEENVKVITIDNDGDMRFDYVIKLPEPLWASRLLGEEVVVTHWMEAPEPPAIFTE